jgi:F420-non-reducing hydrogenase iron-sulfur subunit
VAFEPRIVAILCTWCTYSAADAAGSAHAAYPPNVHIVRVMCSGRVDPALIVETLRDGADAVLVCGCHIGDCHYVNGNHKTAFRIPLLRRLLAQLGVEQERLRLEWISASEGSRFVAVAREMTEQIRALGPLVWHTDADLAAAPREAVRRP